MKLSKTQREIVGLLLRRNIVPTPSLEFRLYQLRAEGEIPCKNNIHALIWHLRRKLPEGAIENKRGRYSLGYRLTPKGREWLNS